jgi:transcriptional regulator with XRE-family HTH domain
MTVAQPGRIGAIMTTNSPSTEATSHGSGGVKLHTLGNRIQWARQRLGMTQRTLADCFGRSRATVVQYEQGHADPSIEQVKRLAEVLEVSPEFLAFGTQGLAAGADPAAAIVALTEVVVEDAETVTGGYGLPRELAKQLGIVSDDAKIYVLGHDAPAFGYHARDRVIVNSRRDFDPLHQVYVVQASFGIEVVRYLPNISHSAKDVNLNGGHGQMYRLPRSDIKLLGAVVGSIRGR